MNNLVKTNLNECNLVLKENSNSVAAIEILKTTAEDIFSYKFNVNMIEPVADNPIFFMSVYPDRSTIDKIVDSISKNEPHMISKLWKQTKEWTIEIDKRILNKSIILSFNVCVRYAKLVFFSDKYLTL